VGRRVLSAVSGALGQVGQSPRGEREEPLAHRGKDPVGRDPRHRRVNGLLPVAAAEQDQRSHGVELEREERGRLRKQLVGAGQVTFGLVQAPLQGGQPRSGQSGRGIDQRTRRGTQRHPKQLLAGHPVTGMEATTGLNGREPRLVAVRHLQLGSFGTTGVDELRVFRVRLRANGVGLPQRGVHEGPALA